jgi:two-component system sensor histidine kinase YesM
MKKLFKEGFTKLSRRLMLMLGICIIPICVLSLISNAREQEKLRETIFASRIENVSYYQALLGQELERLRDISLSYVTDKDFLAASAIYDTMSDYKRAECINNIRQKLLHVRCISPYATNIYVYLPLLKRSINSLNTDYELTDEQITWLVSQRNVGKPILNVQNKVVLCSFYPTLVPINSHLPTMILSIEINTDQINRILAEAADSGGACLAGNGWVIGSEGLEEVSSILTSKKSGARTASLNGTACLLAWAYSELTDTVMVTWLSQDEILGGLKDIQRILWLMLVASVMALTGTAISAYRMVHVPMHQLVRAFQEVERGNSSVRLNVQANDEFQYLYDHFNQMMDRLNSLIQQVYKQRIFTQQSLLKQLQMQINPHFFYNSFFAIQGMIEMGDTQTATEMLHHIGNYFRFITRSGRDAIPLKDEAAHAKSYCEIQRIRFENIFVEFGEVPQMYADFEVPRLILQPLIENAYIYGLENKDSKGNLTVRFFTDKQFVCIEVEDDGGSMSEERLMQLNKNLADTESLETTGMINIHRRLKLFFGEAAGITLVQNEYNGLRLNIRMPKGGRQNVQTPDRGQ